MSRAIALSSFGGERWHGNVPRTWFGSRPFLRKQGNGARCPSPLLLSPTPAAPQLCVPRQRRSAQITRALAPSYAGFRAAATVVAAGAMRSAVTVVTNATVRTIVPAMTPAPVVVVYPCSPCLLGVPGDNPRFRIFRPLHKHRADRFLRACLWHPVQRMPHQSGLSPLSCTAVTVQIQASQRTQRVSPLPPT